MHADVAIRDDDRRGSSRRGIGDDVELRDEAHRQRDARERQQHQREHACEPRAAPEEPAIVRKALQLAGRAAGRAGRQHRDDAERAAM